MIRTRHESTAGSGPLPRGFLFVIALAAGMVAAVPAGWAADTGSASAAERDEKEEKEKGPRNLTFDDLKFDIEKGDKFDPKMLTDKIKEHVGKRIRIKGYILPSFRQRGIKQFVLVRDNMECCFGPSAALFDCIVVEMIPNRSTEYTVRPVTVEGKFSIKELVGPDGKHLAVFHLRGERVLQ